MSTFSGLNIGLSSLYAQRRGLELTGHNVANANTEGYSRQRVRLQGEGGPVQPALHSRYDGVGNGVTVADTQRLRDAFLEARSVSERGTDASLRGQQAALARIEGIFSEPSDSGLQSQLADFWSGWDDVANSPTDLAARSQLLERANTLAVGLNGAADRLEQQWSSSREQLVATVAEINDTLDAVAGYNKAIESAVRAKRGPNDLMDQRDLLVQKLAGLAGVTTRSGPDGTTDVLLGTVELVKGRTAQHLSVAGGSTLPSAPVTVLAAGSPVVPGGTTGGLQVELNALVPAYAQGLNAVVAELHDRVNAQHSAGWDQRGLQGADFFGVDTAGRLQVRISDPKSLAASATAVTGGDRGGANALAMAELAVHEGGPDQLYRRLIVSLGVEAQGANRRVDIQSKIISQLDAARESEAGVNLDEEMTNMLAYQRAYEGAARFMSATDQLLDTLINRTGLVGR